MLKTIQKYIKTSSVNKIKTDVFLDKSSQSIPNPYLTQKVRMGWLFRANIPSTEKLYVSIDYNNLYEFFSTQQNNIYYDCEINVFVVTDQTNLTLDENKINTNFTNIVISNPEVFSTLILNTNSKTEYVHLNKHITILKTDSINERVINYIKENKPTELHYTEDQFYSCDGLCDVFKTNTKLIFEQDCTTLRLISDTKESSEQLSQALSNYTHKEQLHNLKLYLDCRIDYTDNTTKLFKELDDVKQTLRTIDELQKQNLFTDFEIKYYLPDYSFNFSNKHLNEFFDKYRIILEENTQEKFDYKLFNKRYSIIFQELFWTEPF